MKYFVILSFLLLSACGGRVSNITAKTTDHDDLLTCSHIKSEHEINLDKIQDITKEKGAKGTNNTLLLVASPLFLDLSNTEEEEIRALQTRNQRLIQLLSEKSCPPITPEPEITDKK